MPTAERLMTDEEFESLIREYEVEFGRTPLTELDWAMTTIVFMDEIAEEMKAAILNRSPIGDWGAMENRLFSSGNRHSSISAKRH